MGFHVASLIYVLPFTSVCLLCYIYSVFWFSFYKLGLFSLGNNTLILWLEMHFPANFILQWGAQLSFLYNNASVAALVKRRGKFTVSHMDGRLGLFI